MTLIDDCKLVQAIEKYDEIFVEEETKAHGRIEQRTVEVYHNFTATDKEWNELLIELIVVKRKRQTFDTKEKSYKDSSETSCYVSNVSLSAKEYNLGIRKHWHVENKNHYVRDETMGEDKSRIRINPENMAIMRSMAMNIMRKNKVKNIKDEIYKNTLNAVKTICYNGIKTLN